MLRPVPSRVNKQLASPCPRGAWAELPSSGLAQASWRVERWTDSPSGLPSAPVPGLLQFAPCLALPWILTCSAQNHCSRVDQGPTKSQKATVQLQIILSYTENEKRLQSRPMGGL